VIANVDTMLKMIQEAKKKEMVQASRERKAESARLEVTLETGNAYGADDDDELGGDVVKAKKGGIVARFGNFFRLGASPRSASARSYSEAVDDAAVAAPEAAAPVVAEPAKPESKPEEDTQHKNNEQEGESTEGDVSLIPKLIESQLERFDEEGAVRPTIINLGQVRLCALYFLIVNKAIKK
jgi:hypothetical protein